MVNFYILGSTGSQSGDSSKILTNKGEEVMPLGSKLNDGRIICPKCRVPCKFLEEVTTELAFYACPNCKWFGCGPWKNYRRY